MVANTAAGLPPALAAAIPAIRWPLGPTSCPPLYYESLESLNAVRNVPTYLHLLNDLPSHIESLFPPTDTEKRQFGLVATALILIGNGFTDECHNLITPLSWPDDIHFAYGPSVYSQTSVDARALASYVHCLVHRKEALNLGELGMMGFANANYWSNAVAKSPGAALLPHRALVTHIRALAAKQASLQMQTPQEWANRYLQDDTFFESRAVHELCFNVLRGTSNELRDFAEHVAETEVRILLGHALQKAGFDVTYEAMLRPKNVVPSVPSIEDSTQREEHEFDESIALIANRKVSSAHLNNFLANGSIVLRQVLKGDNDARSVAAGIACRLMKSPACRLLDNVGSGQGQVLHLAIPTSEESARHLEKRYGVSLSPGDLFARFSSGDPLVVNDMLWFTFASCETSAPFSFGDRLFGTSGETPTTVVQWSKGTIF